MSVSVVNHIVMARTFFIVLVFALIDLASTSRFGYDFVTCGSALKIVNSEHQVRLHSHDVKYGSGSGQQSVTGVSASDDHNSYWQVRAKTGAACTRGVPVQCGQTVRLMHVSTRRNLHSHHFQSPLSRNLEVSAFGDEGEGDEGDNWVIVCNSQYWSRNERFRIKHVTTEYYLHVTGDTYGRPINGQKEICAYSTPREANYWQTAEGIYVTPSDNTTSKQDDDHDDDDDLEHDEL